MKRSKRLWTGLIILATLCVGCVLAGCDSLYDVAPKEYGAWDGNYIYLGNVRCKTTGEEEERLIERVEKEGVSYEVTHTLDHLFVEEELYLCTQICLVVWME